MVFDDADDFKTGIDDPVLEVDASSELELRNCGPKGYPGAGWVGNMALPKELLAAGGRDMVRIWDARRSGTACGTVLLQGAPEATVRGVAMALVRSERRHPGARH